ncbi:MAG: hypothetical protein WCT37_03715, partial [Patescibacteria group bacterium]
GGAGRTLTFDLHDGVAYTMMIVGQSYGFGITPTAGTFTSLMTAQGINQGYLTINKSALTPATGNIPLGGSAVTLAAFDYKAVGEPINVTSTQLTFTPANSQSATTGRAADYTNIGLYDANGVLVAGTKDGATTTVNTAETFTFTDAYTVPAGTSVYYVKANISSSVLAAEKITVSMPANTITAKGGNSGKTTYTTSAVGVTPPSGAVSANQMTILGGALVVVTAATPVAASVVANAQDQTFAYFDLNATGGGEDAKISSVIVTDTLGNSAAYADLLNLELWGDPDNSDSDVQNIALATSNATATNANTVTFTFMTPLRVSHSSISRLTLKADVASAPADTTTAVGTHTFKIDDSPDVVATGWTTGQTIGETYSGTGQAMGTQAAGLLKVTPSADMAAAAQYVAGTTGNAMMSYKFEASYEDVSVTSLYIATTSATASANVARVKLYLNGTQIGAASGYTLNAGGDANVVFGATEFVVPKDGYATLAIKVDLADKTQLTDAATLEIGLGDVNGDDSTWTTQNGTAVAGSYQIVATGKSSGSVITEANIDTLGTGAGNISASKIMYLYDGVLTVSLNSASPSGTATAGTAKEVLRLNLTATGDTITVVNLEIAKGGTCTVTGTTAAYLKSADLATTYATFAAGTAWLNNAHLDVLTHDSDGAFDTALEIAPGETKTIVLIGDDAACTTANQTLQFTVGGVTHTTSGVSWKNASANTVDAALTKNLPVAGGSLVF